MGSGWSWSSLIAPAVVGDQIRIPCVLRPDVVGALRVEMGGASVIAASGVIQGADLVAGNHDVPRWRPAALLPGIDGIAAAREQVVGDAPVPLRAEILEQADRVGLAAVDQDRVVVDRQQ